MSRKAEHVNIAGNQLVCPVCRHDKFWERQTLMNTAGATFLGFDWANRNADNYICDNCGYVYWFLEK